jgi:hypothetical protein
MLPVGAEDGVSGVDGNAQSGQLVLVYLVARAFRQRLAQTGDLDASLKGVIGGDQAHVSSPDREQPLGRPHQVPVDQGLESTSAIDAG